MIYDDRTRGLLRLHEDAADLDDEYLAENFEEDVAYMLTVRHVERNENVRRQVRAHAALVLLILALVLVEDSTPEPLPIEQTDEVAPLVDQLVPPLIAAPSAPPVRQVALLAA